MNLTNVVNLKQIIDSLMVLSSKYMLKKARTSEVIRNFRLMSNQRTQRKSLYFIKEEEKQK